MKSRFHVAAVAAALILPGCAGTRGNGAGARRIAINSMAAGAGALAAHRISGGSALGTAAGAGAGVLLGEALEYAADAKSREAYIRGFDKGRSDAAKAQYWIMVNQHRAPGGGASGEARFYEVPFPEREVDGVILTPGTRTLRIEE
jgi:hypothetical protein